MSHKREGRMVSRSVAVILLVLVHCRSARAETYRVGPVENHQSVSALVDFLQPGDTVEITGDIVDTFVLSSQGTQTHPVTIKGAVTAQNLRVTRPRITIPRGAEHGLVFRGGCAVLEGLEITGALGDNFQSGSALWHACDNLVIRNCYIHHNRQGIFGDSYSSGSTLIEFSEFDSNGGLPQKVTMMHSVYLNSTREGARMVVQFSYFHNGVDGILLKTRYPRNVIRYNWFESPFHSCVSIVDGLAASEAPGSQDLHPLHSDIVGNVFFQGWSPGPRYATLRLGGEEEGACGTEGDFHIAHNLFVTTRRTPALLPDDEIVHMRVNGNVDHICLYNNVFLEYGVSGAAVYSRGRTWDTPRTRAFVKRRGHGERIVEGANNWVSVKTIGIPEGLVNTFRGINPHFVDLLNFDFRPAKDSPLAGAGLWPLPRGRIVELAPEYEPRRGIAADPTPRPRRKVTPPSIGPFEVPE